MMSLKRKGFDYTKWRRKNLWVGLTSEEILQHAKQVVQEHFHELPEKIRNDIMCARAKQ